MYAVEPKQNEDTWQCIKEWHAADDAKKKKKRLVKKYFTILFSMLAVFFVLSGAVLVISGQGNAAVAVSIDELPEENIDNTSLTLASPEESMGDTSAEPGEKALSKSTEEEKKLVNIALFGVDKGGTRTDVNMVLFFNTETKNITVLSIPRDTKVIMTQEMIADLEKRGRKQYIPYRDGVKGQCKLTEVHAYAGEGYRCQFSVAQLEDLLGIQIDHYIKMDTEGFREIVDAIGGVDMEVAQDLDYDDPYQNLHIHLKAGWQHLDGDKAEQLVRFRKGYASQDLQRISVQQDFLKAFMKTALSTDTILKKLPSLLKFAWDYVETDIQFWNGLSYLQYVNDIELSKVKMDTLPGVGGNFFLMDVKKTKEMIDTIYQ